MACAALLLGIMPLRTAKIVLPSICKLQLAIFIAIYFIPLFSLVDEFKLDRIIAIYINTSVFREVKAASSL